MATNVIDFIAHGAKASKWRPIDFDGVPDRARRPARLSPRPAPRSSARSRPTGHLSDLRDDMRLPLTSPERGVEVLSAVFAAFARRRLESATASAGWNGSILPGRSGEVTR
jgi:hypothetical protein